MTAEALMASEVLWHPSFCNASQAKHRAIHREFKAHAAIMFARHLLFLDSSYVYAHKGISLAPHSHEVSFRDARDPRPESSSVVI